VTASIAEFCSNLALQRVASIADRPARIVALQALADAEPYTRSGFAAATYLADRFAVRPALTAAAVAASDALYAELFA
jgi:hypothetical protein